MYNIFTKIKYSIIYLQSVNLIAILTNLTPTDRKELKTQFIEFLKNPSNGVGRLISKRLKLSDNMCSNAPRRLNEKEYDFIELVVNNYIFS